MMKIIFLCIGFIIYGFTHVSEATSPAIQDLQEIRKSVDEFLKLENKRQKIDFTTARVNPKILVEQCATALEAGWAPADIGLPRKSVQVVCKSSLHDKKGWRVLVPVGE